MVIIEYIQFLNGNAFGLDGERGLCVRACVCVKLLRMNMHKQLNGEWPLNVCVCALFALSKKENKDRKKSHTRTLAHTYDYRQMRRCTMKETYSCV